MTTTLEALVETIPPDNTGSDPQRRTETLTVTADTYAEAYAQVRDQIPDGWRLVHVRTT